MLPPCRTPDFEYPVWRFMLKVSCPAPGSALSWTPMEKFVEALFAVPVPDIVAVLRLNMALVMRVVLKPRSAAGSV